MKPKKSMSRVLAYFAVVALLIGRTHHDTEKDSTVETSPRDKQVRPEHDEETVPAWLDAIGIALQSVAFFWCLFGGMGWRCLDHQEIINNRFLAVVYAANAILLLCSSVMSYSKQKTAGDKYRKKAIVYSLVATGLILAAGVTGAAHSLSNSDIGPVLAGWFTVVMLADLALAVVEGWTTPPSHEE